MPNERFVDEVMGDIADGAEQAYREIGPRVVASMVQICSVPVGYSGSRVIRSLPGQPPRRETGELTRNMGHEVRVLGDDRLALVVYAIGDVAGYLTHGTNRMKPRPFAEPTFDRWADPVCDRVADGVGRR